MAKDPFPKWSEPATKGDVILAVSAVSSCMVDVYLALLSLKLDNKDRLQKYVERLDSNEDKLRALMYEIGGGSNPNE